MTRVRMENTSGRSIQTRASSTGDRYAIVLAPRGLKPPFSPLYGAVHVDAEGLVPNHERIRRAIDAHFHAAVLWLENHFVPLNRRRPARRKRKVGYCRVQQRREIRDSTRFHHAARV